jgi:hypothetical protein
MCNIGELVSMMDINTAFVLGFVELLASLTKIDPRTNREPLSYKNLVPKNLLHMAMNSRVHSGDRVISRVSDMQPILLHKAFMMEALLLDNLTITSALLLKTMSVLL